jgi:tetratricopeptide (TPR) repeat protein
VSFVAPLSGFRQFTQYVGTESNVVDPAKRISGCLPDRKSWWGGTLSEGDADRFWSELQALYQAANRPTLKKLVHLGLEERHPISISHSTINDWLNCKAVPTGLKNERYLAVMIRFLQTRARSNTHYEPLPQGEWGRLLHQAQASRKPGGRLAVPPPRMGEQAPTRTIRLDDERIASSGVLVGRDSELASLSRLVQDVAAGHGGTALVEGEPGIGKSSLVRVALQEAADLGCQVFWGTGDELGRELPLQPLVDGLRVREPSENPRRNTIVGLLRGEFTTDLSLDGPTVLAEQLLALIAEQSAAQPTILVIDDLQWADQATIRFWIRLARAARHMRLLLIGMMRPVPIRDDLLALRRSVDDPARIRLAALAKVEVAELVATLVGGEPDDDLMHLADGAAGNPLYLTELVAALIRGSMVAVAETGVTAVTTGSVPDSLAAAIVDRLSFVGLPTREILRAAALLGVDFVVSDLGTVLGLGVSSLVPAVDEACAAGILTESRNGLSFRHPLIQAALYDEVPRPLRAAWHHDAGRALAEAGAPVDRVARHLRLAVGEPHSPTESIDKWMADWIAQNADLLVGQAPAVAAELLMRAVTGTPVDSHRYGWLTSRLADSLYRIGDRTRAAEIASRAVRRVTDPDVIVDLQWTLVQCHILTGRFAESLATLDHALEIPGLSSQHRARLLALTARTHCGFGAAEKASHVANAALMAGTEAGDNWAIGWALHVLCIVTVKQGRMTDGLSLLDRALALTEVDVALTDLRLLLMINKALVLGGLDQHSAAFIVVRQARDLADQVGTAHRLAQAHGALCQLLFETGRWDDALTEAEVLPMDLKEPAAVCCELGIAAVIRFHRGEIDAARRNLSATLPHSQRIGGRAISSLGLARSLEREHDGARSEALQVLSTQLANRSEEVEETESLLADAVRMAVLTGDSATAQRLTSRAAALAAGSTIPHRRANALYCRGLVDRDASTLLTAAGLYEEASRPLLRAQSLEAAAREFLRTDDLSHARSAFTEALDVYTRLGATTDIGPLQREHELCYGEE